MSHEVSTHEYFHHERARATLTRLTLHVELLGAIEARDYGSLSLPAADWQRPQSSIALRP